MTDLTGERDWVRDQIAEVVFGDDTCNDPDCETCWTTVDALADRVINMVRFRSLQ